MTMASGNVRSWQWLIGSLGVKTGPALVISLLSLSTIDLARAEPEGGDATSPAYYTDPATGIVYRKVHRTVERPVVTTQVQKQERTVYRPETVVDVRPETRTVYSPVVSYGWEPRMRGRWNPFVQPRVEYEHVPRTHWEARSETIERREMRTNWVAETKQVEVPQQVVQIQRQQYDDYEAVGRVAPNPSTPSSSLPSAVASRLRPLDSQTPISPVGPAGSVATVAASTLPVGVATRRNSEQIGLRATDLQSGGTATTLPLPSTGIARGVSPIWR